MSHRRKHPVPKGTRQCRKFVSTHIKRHKKKYGMKQSQAVAVALSEARKKGCSVGRLKKLS